MFGSWRRYWGHNSQFWYRAHAWPSPGYKKGTAPFSSCDAQLVWHSQFSSVGSDRNTLTSILKSYISSNLFPVIAFHPSIHPSNPQYFLLLTFHRYHSARSSSHRRWMSLSNQAGTADCEACGEHWMAGCFSLFGPPFCRCELRVSGCPSRGQSHLCNIMVWKPTSLASVERLSCADIKVYGWIWNTWYPVFGHDRVYQCIHQCTNEYTSTVMYQHNSGVSVYQSMTVQLVCQCAHVPVSVLIYQCTSVFVY